MNISRASRSTVAGAVILLGFPATHYADAVLRFSSGATPAAIQGAVNQFRTELGGGAKTITWDENGLPMAPNKLSPNIFSANGVGLSTPGIGLQVSSDNAAQAPVRFGNINANYSSIFQPFSGARMFTALDSPEVDVNFFMPGFPATSGYVNGFGAVFADVDFAGSTTIQFFDAGFNELYTGTVPASPNNGLSFLGVYFTSGEQVAHVIINSGNAALGAGVLDGGGTDLVVMDDFIFGSVQAVPEASSMALFGMGALVLMSFRRWRK